MQNSKWLPWAIIGIVIVVIAGWFISTGNQMVALNEGVQAQWGQVENVYQRRADLIPNLVNTVKGYAKHEADVLEKVTEARSHVGQIRVNADKPESLQAFEQAQGQLSSALSRLMVVAEKYPDLKANTNFQELQSQLEGTENRIAVERKRFNESAQNYNVYIRQFPASMVASFRGFQPKPYFQAAAGANTAPKVEF
ncbi:MAG: LemA family protein [Oligoflexia bacterium]|nr:LemA family protein [Oligoflexia bacterium]